MLQRGLDERVAPLLRLEVLHAGQPVISLGNAAPDCVFDVASLTKVMCTTALVLRGGLSLAAPLRSLLPEAQVDATVEDLLFHRSGLPAWAPFFARGPEVLAQVLATPAGPRGAAVYSDLGFILLGAAMEASAGAPLDALYAAQVGLGGFRRLSRRLPVPTHLAPTGDERPRPPAPGQEGLWSLATSPSSPGEVDDDNAFAMDGVSGHAGLFATAAEVARFGQAVLERRFDPASPWAPDAATPGSTRALGFDTPSPEGASCGQRFGRAGPAGAIGHLGFTGTSLWVDLDRQLVVALLTNRVAYGRTNTRIRAFRPLVHDAVLDALGL